MTNHHILNQNEVKKLLKYKLIEKTTFTTIKILCHDFCQMGRGSVHLFGILLSRATFGNQNITLWPTRE